MNDYVALTQFEDNEQVNLPKEQIFWLNELDECALIGVCTTDGLPMFLLIAYDERWKSYQKSRLGVA